MVFESLLKSDKDERRWQARSMRVWQRRNVKHDTRAASKCYSNHVHESHQNASSSLLLLLDH